MLDAITIALSPPPGQDYPKSQAGWRAANEDWDNDVQFIHGVAFISDDTPTLNRTNICDWLSEHRITEATIIIYNRTKSELGRFRLVAEEE